MKFGVNLINFGPSANPARLKSWAQLTEALGFHHLLISDHLAVTRDVATKYPAPFYEPISTLGWLAGVTERVMIGTTVLIVPYRSPLEVAKSFANIDQLSGGRVILGVGAGWAEQEFNALNAPFKNRGAVTDEYIDAIKTLWSQNPASFNGEFVQFDGISSAPVPVQRSRNSVSGSAPGGRNSSRTGSDGRVHAAGPAPLLPEGLPVLPEGLPVLPLRAPPVSSSGNWRPASRCSTM